MSCVSQKSYPGATRAMVAGGGTQGRQTPTLAYRTLTTVLTTVKRSTGRFRSFTVTLTFSLTDPTNDRLHTESYHTGHAPQALSPKHAVRTLKRGHRPRRSVCVRAQKTTGDDAFSSTAREARRSGAPAALQYLHERGSKLVA